MGKGQFSLEKNLEMKYVAAYCLMALAGKSNISEADLKKFMTAAGADVDGDALKSVCSALQGKELHEVINAGFGKISSLSLGGGGGAQAQSGPAQTSGPAKEEAKVEEPEEEEEDMDLGDLFG